ncbi:MAG: class I SAM-dependent methyltransferase [Candidatus Binataceae bacterium]
MQDGKQAAALVRQARTALKEQYKDSSNFRKRTALHARFGANRYSFYRWVFDQFELANCSAMLELGCGPGSLWNQNADRLPDNTAIVASDFSGGMVREARANLGANAARLRFCQLDAVALPFKDGSFDVVVAMLMLYHVDDRPTAFREIRRVLRSGGTLYASTMGNAHLRELREIAARVFGTARVTPASDRFGLETGYDQLRSAFSSVEVRRYASSMNVTEAQPVIDYFLSTARYRQLPHPRLEALRSELEREIADHGGIAVSTDLGMLIARP